MDTLSMPMVSGDQFETERFNTDTYVKRVAAESVYASNIADHRDKLNRLAQQTAEEIKQNVYKNYGNFMETSKEVGHLEGKMSQLRQSLDEQRKLLHLFKNLNIGNTVNTMLNASNTQKATTSSSSLSLLLEQVEGCSLIAQKPNRNLLYHSDLEALHLDDFSVSHKLHAYLLTDSLLLTLPQRKRNKTNFNPTKSTSGSNSTNDVNAGLKTGRNYLYKFHAFYELQEIKIINIEDSKEVRNSFQLHKFPECIAFRCANAHIKKEWLENIDNAKRQLRQTQLLDGTRRVDLTSHVIEEEDEYYNQSEEEDEDEEYDENGERIVHTSLLSGKSRKGDLTAHLDGANEHDRVRIMRELFAEFDILLAQRDFDKAVEMLLKIKQSCSNNNSKTSTRVETGGSSESDHAAVQQLIYKQKESELIGILRRDLLQSKERGNSKGVVKTGKRVVNSMIKLKIYDEAMDLFIDYHKYLNSETLRRIKLEESNQVYMNNVLSSFFDNLKQSYASFCEQFGSLKSVCFSTYLGWCDTEIEILIKKLQSQHYLGRHFDLTIENCELIFEKAKQFVEFDVKFWFETKLSPILEQKIVEQQDVLVSASIQRSKFELEDKSSAANNEQNRQLHVQKLIKDLEARGLLIVGNSSTSSDKFNNQDIELIKKCTVTGLQFSRGVIDYFLSCMRVYYQDINFALVESIVKAFKAEKKIYGIYLDKHMGAGATSSSSSSSSNRISKQDIYNNVCLVERVLAVIVAIYGAKAGIHSKHFVKVMELIAKFKKDNFANF